MSGLLEVYQSGSGISGSFDDHRIDIDPEHQSKRRAKKTDNAESSLLSNEDNDTNNNNNNTDNNTRGITTHTPSVHLSALEALQQNAQELSHSGGPSTPPHNTFKHFLQQHAHSIGGEPEEHDELWDKVYQEHSFKHDKGKGKAKAKVTPKNSTKEVPKPAAIPTSTGEKAAPPVPPKKKKGKGKGKKKIQKEVEMDSLSELEKGVLTEEVRSDMEKAERVMDYRTCGCLFGTAFLLCIILFNLPH